MEDVVVSNPFHTICSMQVCCKKGLDREEIKKQANIKNPSGVNSQWEPIIDENDLKSHELPKINLPVQCGDHEDREHILLFC